VPDTRGGFASISGFMPEFMQNFKVDWVKVQYLKDKTQAYLVNKEVHRFA
jgi:hypothetical protein